MLQEVNNNLCLAAVSADVVLKTCSMCATRSGKAVQEQEHGLPWLGRVLLQCCRRANSILAHMLRQPVPVPTFLYERTSASLCCSERWSLS